MPGGGMGAREAMHDDRSPGSADHHSIIAPRYEASPPWLEDAPELATHVYGKRPASVAESARHVEAQHVERQEKARANRRVESTNEVLAVAPGRGREPERRSEHGSRWAIQRAIARRTNHVH